MHRREQDRKTEWWRRTQWALDHAMSDDEPSRALGASVLALQAASDLADEEDNRVISAFTDLQLSHVAGDVPAGDLDVEYARDLDRPEGETSR